MARHRTINLRVTEIEYNALKAYAEQEQITMSEAMREYIKELRKQMERAKD